MSDSTENPKKMVTKPTSATTISTISTSPTSAKIATTVSQTTPKSTTVETTNPTTEVKNPENKKILTNPTIPSVQNTTDQA